MTKIKKVLHLPTGRSITMYDIDNVGIGCKSIMLNFCDPENNAWDTESCDVFSTDGSCQTCLLSTGYHDFDLVKDQFLIEEYDDGNQI